MARYIKFKEAEHSTRETPQETSFKGFKTALDLLYYGIELVILVVYKLKNSNLIKQTSHLPLISHALGYMGAALQVLQLSVIKNINAQTIADALFNLIIFAFEQVNSFASGIISSLWNLARQLPYFIAMFWYQDPAKKEKLFTIVMKNSISTILSSLVALLLVGVGIITAPEVAVPVIVVATTLTLLPVIKDVVKKAVIPAVKTIIKETVPPLIKSLMGNELYRIVTKSVKTVFSYFKTLIFGDTAKFKGNTKYIQHLTKEPEPFSYITLPLVPRQSKSAKPKLHYTLSFEGVSAKRTAIEQSVVVPLEKPNEPFDYFKYLVKDKRPLSALLKDIAFHKKQLEQVMDTEHSFFDRAQYEKRADKVHVLGLFESFLLQWQQFSNMEANNTIQKAFILEEKNGGLISIPFVDLVKDRDKIIKAFHDYILKHYSTALYSLLHRGKVETLIKEGYAWMKRPTFEEIQKRLDDYLDEYIKKHDKQSETILFLLSLLQQTHHLLYDQTQQASCNINGLILTRDELINSSKKQDLHEKIEGFAVHHYPAFSSSYESRGTQYAIFQAILRYIDFYEPSPAALEISSNHFLP